MKPNEHPLPWELSKTETAELWQLYDANGEWLATCQSKEFGEQLIAHENLIQSLQPRPIEEAPKDKPFLAFEGDNIYKCEFYNKDDDTGKIHYSAYCGQPVVESPQPETFIPLSAIQALGDGV